LYKLDAAICGAIVGLILQIELFELVTVAAVILSHVYC